MSRLSLVCPHCAREGKLPESVKTLPGRVKCPGCQKDFHPAAAGGDEFVVVPEGTDQLKETAKRAATAIGDGIKQTARKAKDYAESDQAKALMEKTRRTAAEVGEKAKVTVSSMQGSGTRFLENPIVIGLSMLFCFPIGLFFVWRHSRWSKVAKSAWTGAFCAILMLLFIRGSQMRQEAKAGLSEADARWQAGDHAAAVAKYRSVLHVLDTDEKPLAYGRIIDFEMESGNGGAARTLLEEARRRRIHPSVDTPEARSLLAKIETESTSPVSAAPSRIDHTDVSEGLTPKMMTSAEVLAILSPPNASPLGSGPNGEPIVTREGDHEEFSSIYKHEGYVNNLGYLQIGKHYQQTGYSGMNGTFVKHGVETLWYKKGKSRYCEFHWNNNLLDGPKIFFHANGEISEIVGMKKGVAEGINYAWHEDGKSKFFATYRAGRMHGKAVDWYPDGRLKGEVSFIDGKRDGILSEWSIDGKKTVTPFDREAVLYSRGKSTKRCFYWKLLSVCNFGSYGSTHYIFNDNASFLSVFGKPDEGYLPGATIGISPGTMCSYKCTDGSVALTCANENGKLHVMLDPDKTY